MEACITRGLYGFKMRWYGMMGEDGVEEPFEERMRILPSDDHRDHEPQTVGLKLHDHRDLILRRETAHLQFF